MGCGSGSGGFGFSAMRLGRSLAPSLAEAGAILVMRRLTSIAVRGATIGCGGTGGGARASIVGDGLSVGAIVSAFPQGSGACRTGSGATVRSGRCISEPTPGPAAGGWGGAAGGASLRTTSSGCGAVGTAMIAASAGSRGRSRACSLFAKISTGDGADREASGGAISAGVRFTSGAGEACCVGVEGSSIACCGLPPGDDCTVAVSTSFGDTRGPSR